MGIIDATYIIPDSVVSIEYQAFSENEYLTKIVIPNSVKNIESYAFSHCSNLISAVISNQVYRLFSGTFYACTNLITVSIPSSVTIIDSDVFGACSCIKDVYYGGIEEKWSELSIKSGNSYLLEANIHYNYEMCDINNDGKATNEDLIILARHIAKIEPLADATLADVNGDGEVNAKDLTALARLLKQ